jgi:hypothetical protein
MMSGQGGKGHGAGHGGHAGRGSGGSRGRGYSSGKTRMTKVGLCKDLKGNIFNFGLTLAANQMQITQEKIAQYMGAKYREDIANGLQNKMRVIILTPAYASTTLTCHALQIALVRNQQSTMRVERLASRTLLEAELAHSPDDRNLITELAMLNNAIALGEFKAAQDVLMELTNQEWLNYSNKCQNQSRRSATLDTYQGQAYSLIFGQCT